MNPPGMIRPKPNNYVTKTSSRKNHPPRNPKKRTGSEIWNPQRHGHRQVLQQQNI